MNQRPGQRAKPERATQAWRTPLMHGVCQAVRELVIGRRAVRSQHQQAPRRAATSRPSTPVLDAYPGDLRWRADGLSPVPGKAIDPPGFTGGGRP